MNKKEVNKAKKITMEKFLREYCGFDNEIVIEALTMLSHKELKEVCKKVYEFRLCSLPFECVTENELGSGEILFVSDAFNNPAPYKNPVKKHEQDVLRTRSATTQIDDQCLSYEEIIDALDEFWDIEDVDVSSIGSFDIKDVDNTDNVKVRKLERRN